MSDQTEYFTVVFRGDVRKLGFNPMTAETAYGEPVGVGVGDCLSELWKIQDGTQQDMETSGVSHA
jgi:hypothetical protein